MLGRSPYADVVIADLSVEPHHAELVVTDDGRLHLTDGATETGTWTQDGGADRWVRIRQTFVRPEQRLRLGDYACTAADLLRATGLQASRGIVPGIQELGPRPSAPTRLQGRVERDPVTGEIVRRRP